PVTPPLPADPVGQYVSSNESHIWYARWDCDRPKERVPVLLLHGGLLNSDYFGALIPVLLAHHYTVIAMDSRGQGRSSYAGATNTYQLLKQDVLALLGVLQIPTVSLVGWSGGGIIGIELAISHPHRRQRLCAFG